MKELFQLFEGTKLTYPRFEGVVCGFNEENFILAVEAEGVNSFKTLTPADFVLEEYKDEKYSYVLEDESAIERQLKNLNYNGSTQENQTVLQQAGGSYGETK